MKAYILLFLFVMFLIIGSIAVLGVTSTLKAVTFRNVQPVSDSIKTANDILKHVHADARDYVRKDVEGASSSLDSALALLSQWSVFTKRIYYDLAFRLLAAAFLGMIAGFILWFTTYRLVVRPINRTVQAMMKISEGDFSNAIVPQGVKEVRYLQTRFNDMVRKLGEYQLSVKTMERQNIGRFLVHQIRNSLTSIELSARNIDMIVHNADVSVSSEIILEETKKIAALLEQFRSLYKFPEPVKISVELNQLAEGVAKAYDSVVVFPAEGPVHIEADRGLLEQALMNIIKNGIESMSSPGHVEIRVSAGSVPSIEITDTGCGMGDEEIARVFDEYYTTKRQGMGIGLSFVKRVMDSHGFSIHIHSEKHKGTRVRIEFHEKDKSADSR